MTTLRIGVSSCLRGENVRWDGGHKKLSWRTDDLDARVEWIPTCPEVEIGLGVPRAPIRLVQTERGVRLREVESGRDLTDRMSSWAGEKVRGFGDLDGYVLKSRSPSCGLVVPVHDGSPRAGMFAAVLRATHPELPIVEESDLDDAVGRRRFLERVVQYRALRERSRTPPDG